ncbi:MAG TPA: EAL domain-containing protein [Stenomitos sp.]
MNTVINKASTPSKPISVLIVEDELIAAENISRNLKKQGYQVSAIVDSGEDAIQRATSDRPDLVLMDIMLHGTMDGIQAAEQIHHQLNIPLIYMTAYGDDTTLERAKQTHPSGYLVKPFKPQSLKIAIEVALQRDRAQLQQTHHLVRRLQHAEHQLHTQALQEPLTGLPNRRALEQHFASMVQQYNTQGSSSLGSSPQLLPILCLKIRHWQRIHTYFGYQKSDELWRAIAKRLEQQLRKPIYLAYLGTEELAIILPPVAHRHEVVRQAQQLLQSFQTPFSVDDQSLSLAGRIGISLYPQDGQNLDDLLTLSSNALSGGESSPQAQSIVFHTQQLNHASTNTTPLDLELENSLRTALANQELHLRYQPIVSLPARQIIGAEVLLRWHHRQQGWISPATFIPIAEKFGLMPQIGLWLVEQVCLYQRNLANAGFQPIRLSINLSPSQFFQNTLVHDLSEIVKRTQVDPRWFQLEITEDIVIKDFEWSERQIKALKKLGFSIAMDDFGKGHSSLLYLQSLSFDVIKIDQAFVRNIHQKNTNQVIVKALTTMAHQLNMKVVAEGIEVEEELNTIQELAGDFSQGYLTGKPMAGEALQITLAARQACHLGN